MKTSIFKLILCCLVLPMLSCDKNEITDSSLELENNESANAANFNASDQIVITNDSTTMLRVALLIKSSDYKDNPVEFPTEGVINFWKVNSEKVQVKSYEDAINGIAHLTETDSTIIASQSSTGKGVVSYGLTPGKYLISVALSTSQENKKKLYSYRVVDLEDFEKLTIYKTFLNQGITSGMEKWDNDTK